MSSIRCIVAATDFSTFSGRVVQRAARIARQHDAEMHLLHMTHWLERQRAAAGGLLDALLESIDGAAGVTRLIEPGFPPVVICQSIDERRVELAVLGRHGHGGGLQDWLLGSVSKDVAFAATCDVLMIGPGEPG